MRGGDGGCSIVFKWKTNDHCGQKQQTNWWICSCVFRFDLSASGDTVVVVIQVHNRGNYLRHLLASLKKARHIEQTLLIFSHDFYDPDIMEVVKTVGFCPVSLSLCTATDLFPVSSVKLPSQVTKFSPLFSPTKNGLHGNICGCSHMYSNFRLNIWSVNGLNWMWTHCIKILFSSTK